MQANLEHSLGERASEPGQHEEFNLFGTPRSGVLLDRTDRPLSDVLRSRANEEVNRRACGFLVALAIALLALVAVIMLLVA